MISHSHTALLGLALAVAAGCAEHRVYERGAVGGVRQDDFWPPPAATSLWTISPSANTFGGVADLIASLLHRAGYDEVRWHPIGAECAHGFAVTTRLERIDDDASAKPSSARWVSLYPEASTLRWLEGARAPRFPFAGRYRTFLIAFTDLPMTSGGRPTRWNEETVMAGPHVPDIGATPSCRGRAVSTEYRIGVHVYEYEQDSWSTDGALLREPSRPAPVHVWRAGLIALGR
jgi:hypothetical protein